jgi:glycosyltransferase involved in cell wall biosynthesis
MPISSKKIRVACVTSYIAHFEAPLFRLCARIKEWDFMVFCWDSSEAWRYNADYQCNISWGENVLEGYASRYVDNKQLASILDVWHPDVTLFYGYSWPGAVSLIARNWLIGRPQIHRGTLNYFLDPRRGWKGKLMRPWRSILFRMFTAHHYGGDYSRKVLLDAGVSPDALFFVPYSVDTPYFLAMADSPEQQRAAAAIREKLAWPGDAEVALYIAQHNWFKGPDIMLGVFIEWAKDNPRARLLLVGSGRMTDELQTLAAARLAPEQYHFAGFIPSAQTVPYYLTADIVVCTSRYETWARMVNEAMLCRRPCVLNARVPAAGGLVEDGINGYVVSSTAVESNIDAYVAALQRHFAKPISERQKMGETAREKAREFSYEAHMDEAVAAVRYAFEHGRT